ncbi:hypothetical protein [Pseudoalteromonas phenolica]|uniref:Uncharacterized protein n=1 Tax=Pseudoalteromonas phenolica TaxID=161398 RepID=A0A0S2K6K1_9GAMM|nr:hypothetical protein [Pseudoalteromonas phenolica]ALO43964.1 hypothetical protein PP2015_3489 [Pseudoalteromonas phenolica]MBE0356937.1 hypothetical protein [Pseudoalteromonas phenolica O-BC30]TMO54164.1 hypothetical protein CWC21_16460 [Pseudoalteromonas phenolica]|tara:strand:- start:288 stop:470 length:183 start_codon:yes stop_codon:yes gene_type:complete
MKISEITQMPSELKSQGVIKKRREEDVKQSSSYKQEVANLMQLEEQEKEHTEQNFLYGYN